MPSKRLETGHSGRDPLLLSEQLAIWEKREISERGREKRRK